MGFFDFCKQSLGFEHNLQNSDHAACLTWSQCLAMYNFNLRLPTYMLCVPIFYFAERNQQLEIINEHRGLMDNRSKTSAIVSVKIAIERIGVKTITLLVVN